MREERDQFVGDETERARVSCVCVCVSFFLGGFFFFLFLLREITRHLHVFFLFLSVCMYKRHDDDEVSRQES